MTTTAGGHTPGPWTADGGLVYGTDGYALAETDGVHLHRDFDADKGHWNYEDGSARDISEAEEEANARLIAASPRLQAENERLQAVLEAAEAVLRAGNHTQRDPEAAPCPACEAWPRLGAAVAAIRQAEAER